MLIATKFDFQKVSSELIVISVLMKKLEGAR